MPWSLGLKPGLMILKPARVILKADLTHRPRKMALIWDPVLCQGPLPGAPNLEKAYGSLLNSYKLIPDPFLIRADPF